MLGRFPFGLPALLFTILVLVSGGYLLLHPVEHSQATLQMWIFAPEHLKSYQDAIPAFQRRHPGVTVEVQLVPRAAVSTRLQAAFWSGLEVPDLAEVAIDNAGAFFRGPLEHIGFVDLTSRIKAAGLLQRMVAARFAPYTSRGHIFGLPHDVHPVQIAYRRDLFAKLGLDPARMTTWDDFIAAGRRVTVPGKIYLLELFDTRSAHLDMCMFQRGGGYFSPDGQCIFDDEIAVQTMLWYVPLVAGSHPIAASVGSGPILNQAVQDGYFLSLIAPDWRTKTIEKDMPGVSGKMALMPLPAVRRGTRPTSTWGGTMLGITRKSPHVDLAWDLACHLYLSKPDLGQRFRDNNILPALREAWHEPAYSERRPFWSNQPIGTLYARLAPQVPFQYSSPFIADAKDKLGQSLVACIAYYKQHGEQGFEPFVRRQLKTDADSVRALMARNPF